MGENMEIDDQGRREHEPDPRILAIVEEILAERGYPDLDNHADYEQFRRELIMRLEAASVDSGRFDKDITIYDAYCSHHGFIASGGSYAGVLAAVARHKRDVPGLHAIRIFEMHDGP
ncbi:MAG: hypothetical protein JXI32_08655 [Deltaproteobacteria bacterium]|nr:hypothetical protein [Deltaproteobacteria bacterium]